MNNLYIIYRDKVEKIPENFLIINNYSVCVDGIKIYNSQLDDLILFKSNIVAVTFDKNKIDFLKSELEDFFTHYHIRGGKNYGL